MWICYFEFKVNHEKRLKQLQHFVKDFQRDRDQHRKATVEDGKWLDYFEEEMLKQFWWPTEADWKEYQQLWFSLSPEERPTDPRLQHPREFTSWLDSLYTGEHQFLSCKKIASDLARLEYRTWSWPYGSVEALRQIIHTFGFTILREDT